MPARNGSLEEVRVGGRDAVPAQRVEEGRELARLVEALGGEIPPALLFEDPAVELVVPEDLERLALGVVVRAGQLHDGRTGRRPDLDDLLDEPTPRAHLHQLAHGGGMLREELSRPRDAQRTVPACLPVEECLCGGSIRINLSTSRN